MENYDREASLSHIIGIFTLIRQHLVARLPLQARGDGGRLPRLLSFLLLRAAVRSLFPFFALSSFTQKKLLFSARRVTYRQGKKRRKRKAAFFLCAELFFFSSFPLSLRAEKKQFFLCKQGITQLVRERKQPPSSLF
jgi:hypothetical protein